MHTICRSNVVEGHELLSSATSMFFIERFCMAAYVWLMKQDLVLKPEGYLIMKGDTQRGSYPAVFI